MRQALVVRIGVRIQVWLMEWDSNDLSKLEIMFRVAGKHTHVVCDPASSPAHGAHLTVLSSGIRRYLGWSRSQRGL